MSQTPDIVEQHQRRAFSADAILNSAPSFDGRAEVHAGIVGVLCQRDTIITQLRERLDAVEKERDQLRLSNERMREACSTALTHVLELERAWMRGVIDERDDGGGTRSNRNVEVRNALQTALTAESGTEVEG